MSMSQVNRAFVEGLGSKATSGGCSMTWERGCDGVQRQRLTCVATPPSGQYEIVTGLFDGRADLANAARKLASDFAEGIK
jgi:hypothetical protein